MIPRRTLSSSLTSVWLHGDDDANPEALQGGIEAAAFVLASVGLVRDELGLDDDAVGRLPTWIAEPIFRARRRGFTGDLAARDFLIALEAGAPPPSGSRAVDI